MKRVSVPSLAGLDAGHDAADPAPGVCGVEELLEAADLASARIGLETCQGARLQSADVTLPCAGRGEAEHVVDPVRLAPVELAGKRSGCRRGRGSTPGA